MKNKILPVLILAVLGFLAYGSSLQNQFVWDDSILIENNVYIKNISYLPRIFTTSIGGGAGKKISSFRPVQTLTYMVDYFFWRLKPFGYHLTNILLHVLAAAALYWLLNLLYADKRLVFLASALFVVCPLHAVVVICVSGRADSLALAGLLLAFIFYIKSLHSKKISFCFLSGFSFLLAVLSRESALILPALILLYHYTFRQRVSWGKYLPFLIIPAIYGLLRFMVLKVELPHRLLTTTMHQRLPGFLVALTEYIRLLFLPLHMHMEYGNRLFSFSDPRVLIGGLILLSVLIFILLNAKSRGVVFFSLGWFLIALLPLSNLYPLTAYMAEHWLYLPSVGFFLLLAAGLNRLARRYNLKILVNVLFAAMLFFYTYFTVKHNRHWRSNIRLYEQTLKYAPESARILTNLGIIYHSLGRHTEAVDLFKRAIAIKPEFIYPYLNLGNAYRHSGRRLEAINTYKKAIAVDPQYPESYNNLATVYNDSQEYPQAIALYKKAIALNPLYPEACNNLAGAYHALGEYSQAIKFYKRAINLNPDFAAAYNNLGTTHYFLNQGKEAVFYYQQAIKINSGYADAYYNLGTVHSAYQNHRAALSLYQKAVKIDPGHARAYHNIGTTYYNWQQYGQAIKHYRKALEISPDYRDVHYNLGLTYTRLENYKEAIAAYQKAIAIFPEYAAAEYKLAEIYQQQKKRRLARKHCRRALELGFKVPAELLRSLEDGQEK